MGHEVQERNRLGLGAVNHKLSYHMVDVNLEKPLNNTYLLLVTMKLWELKKELNSYLLLHRIEQRMWKLYIEDRSNYNIDKWRKEDELAIRIRNIQNDILEGLGIERQYDTDYHDDTPWVLKTCLCLINQVELTQTFK